MNWLTRTELVQKYPRWGSASFIDHMVRAGYLSRMMQTKQYRTMKRNGPKRVVSLVEEKRRVYVYCEDQYVRYWEENERHMSVLAELREENGYD